MQHPAPLLWDYYCPGRYRTIWVLSGQQQPMKYMNAVASTTNVCSKSPLLYMSVCHLWDMLISASLEVLNQGKQCQVNGCLQSWGQIRHRSTITHLYSSYCFLFIPAVDIILCYLQVPVHREYELYTLHQWIISLI